MKFVRMYFHQSIEFVNHEGIALVHRAREFYYIAEADVERILALGVAKTEQALLEAEEQAASKAADVADQAKADAKGSVAPEVPVSPAPEVAEKSAE